MNCDQKRKRLIVHKMQIAYELSWAILHYILNQIFKSGNIFTISTVLQESIITVSNKSII